MPHDGIVINMGIAETFKVLSDPQRREILEILKIGRRSAGELAQMLDISAPAMSYHLRLLKGAELVLECKEKNFIFYELNITVFEEIVLWIESLTAVSDTSKHAGESCERGNKDE